MGKSHEKGRSVKVVGELWQSVGVDLNKRNIINQCTNLHFILAYFWRTRLTYLLPPLRSYLYIYLYLVTDVRLAVTPHQRASSASGLICKSHKSCTPVVDGSDSSARFCSGHSGRQGHCQQTNEGWVNCPPCPVFAVVKPFDRANAPSFGYSSS